MRAFQNIVNDFEVYDNLNEKEILDYKKELEKRKHEREKKKKRKKKWNINSNQKIWKIFELIRYTYGSLTVSLTLKVVVVCLFQYH